MAGSKLLPASIQLISSSRYELRALQQLPRIRQTFLSSRSRASSIGLQATRFHQLTKWDLHRERWKSRGETRLEFGTSTGRRAEPTNKTSNNAKSTKTDESVKPPTSALHPSTIRATISAKVSNLKTHENIYTIPNILTFSRLLATPVLGYLIVNNHHLYAFGLFAYAGFSDLLDGWIARKWKLQTVVGSVVDPMADKALMTTVVGCLAVNGSLSLPLATIILGRDISLAIAAIYYRYASLPAPKTFTRYWDFSLPSAEVHPTTISKLNTFLQLILVGTTLSVNLLHDPVAAASSAGGALESVRGLLGGEEGVTKMVQGMSAVVASTTLWSGLSYVWNTKAVTILGENETLKKKQGFRGRMIIGVSYGTVIAVAAWLAYGEWTKGEEKEEDGHVEQKVQK